MNYRQIRVLLVLFSLLQIMDLKAQDFLSSLFTIEAGANYYRIPIGNEQWISGITPSLGARYDLRPNKTFGYGIGMTYSPRLDREKTKLGNVHNFYIDFSLSGSWYPKNYFYFDLGLQRSFLLARNYSENNNTTPIDPPRSHYAITTGAGVNMLKNSRLLMRYSIPVDLKGYRNVQIAFLFNLNELRKKPKNKMTSLEKAFEDPAATEILVLHRQQITELPSQIKQLTNLRELIVDGCMLKSLPTEMGELKQLVKLSAKFNEINNLPESLGSLKMLEELHLDYNKIHEFPGQIGELENLRFLYLSNNNLTKIPPEIGKLTKLVELDVSNNVGLLQLPLEISNLKNLEKLYISPTTIFPIPFIPPNARLEIIVVEPGSPQINLYRR